MPKPVRVPTPARRKVPAPAVQPAPSREQREAAILERDRPLIAAALEWAAGAGPGASLPLPNASVIGLAAVRAALEAEGFACEVRGCALILLEGGK